MALLWVNPATNNRFANKHLYLVPGTPTLQQLVDKGSYVFEQRVKAYKANSGIGISKIKKKDKQGKHLSPSQTNKLNEAKSLDSQFGSNLLITESTLIVLSQAGLQSLEAAIIAKNYKSGLYSIKNGVVFNMTAAGFIAGLVADVKLGIRACAPNHEVYHLDDVTITAKLKPSTSAARSNVTMREVPGGGGELGMHFKPTTSELTNAIGKLKKVGAPSTAGVPLWAMSEATGVDLSFLEDD